MVEMINSRTETWDELPFATMAEVSAFSAELDKIVVEAVPDPPREVKSQVVYEHGKTGWMSSEGFHDALPGLAPLSDVHHLYVGSAFVDEDGPAAKADDSEFRASLFIGRGGIDGLSATLTVEGRKLTAVEGVKATAAAVIECYAEAKRHKEEEEAERARQEAEENAERRRLSEAATKARRTAAEGLQEARGGREKFRPASMPSEPRWKRILRNDYTVEIVGGVIAALVAGFILFLVLQT